MKLRELARNPYDLSAKEAVNAKRIQSMQMSACGIKMLYGTERVDDKTMEALAALAKDREVMDKLKAMMDGEVVNKIEGYDCENRMVLHTAMRDVFDSPNQAKAAKEAADLEKAELTKLKDWCGQLEKDNKFTDMLLIGIGGSDLGPRALYLALQGYKKEGRRVHIVSNVDPDDAAQVLPRIRGQVWEGVAALAPSPCPPPASLQSPPSLPPFPLRSPPPSLLPPLLAVAPIPSGISSALFSCTALCSL